MRYLILLSALCLSTSYGDPQPGEAAWKGSPYEKNFNFSAVQGIGMLNGNTGYAFNGYVGPRILSKGFLEDVNDEVFLELMGGPLFLSAGVAWNVALQMRWNFHYDHLWSFYGAAGPQMLFSGAGLGNLSQIFPRIALGVLWQPLVKFSIRGEITADFIGVGLQLGL